MHFTCINIPKLNLYSSSSIASAKLTREYLPGNSTRNNACTSHVSWEPKEEGMMSASASFPSV